MRSPQYIPVGPVYCWDSGSVEQAFEVALVEQEVTVVVEQEVEAEWREEYYTGASTPIEVHSTEAVTGHVNDKSEEWAE